jgi:hypothetical protein
VVWCSGDPKETEAASTLSVVEAKLGTTADTSPSSPRGHSDWEAFRFHPAHAAPVIELGRRRSGVDLGGLNGAYRGTTAARCASIRGPLERAHHENECHSGNNH